MIILKETRHGSDSIKLLDASPSERFVEYFGGGKMGQKAMQFLGIFYGIYNHQ